MSPDYNAKSLDTELEFEHYEGAVVDYMTFHEIES
jgi:hypothetical protein